MKTFITSVFIICVSALAFGQNATLLYQEHCSDCHGAQLQGGSAQSLVDGVWQFGSEEQAIGQNIRQGIKHLGMPGYGDALSEQEITTLARYLLESEKTGIAQHEKIPKTLKTLDYDIAVEIFAEGLEIPWNLAFLNKNTALVTEQPGRLRVIEKGHLYSKPIDGTPKVLAEGQGGLLAVAFDPDYLAEGNQWVYLAFSHGLDPEPNGKRAGAMTKLVRGKINGNVWTNEQVIFEAPHSTYKSTRHHFGTRIVFDEKKPSISASASEGPRQTHRTCPNPTARSTVFSATEASRKTTRSGTSKRPCRRSILMVTAIRRVLHSIRHQDCSGNPSTAQKGAMKLI